MKTLLTFLLFFSILALPASAQDKLRVKNYTERPDTEPPYDRPSPVGAVKIKKTETATARTSSPARHIQQIRHDSTPPGPRIPIKAKAPASNARRKNPTRRPAGH